jgi:hypothetical protein
MLIMGAEQSQFQPAEGPRFLTKTSYSEQFKYDANRRNFEETIQGRTIQGLGKWYTELKKWTVSSCYIFEQKFWMQFRSTNN